MPFNTIVVASLFTFARCPSFFCSTFRLLQFIFQRHPDFLTTRLVAWQILLWHLLKPLFVALMVCKNLTIDMLYYCVVRELAWVFFLFIVFWCENKTSFNQGWKIYHCSQLTLVLNNFFCFRGIFLLFEAMDVFYFLWVDTSWHAVCHYRPLNRSWSRSVRANLAFRRCARSKNPFHPFST